MSLGEKCDELEDLKTIVLTPSPPPHSIHSHLGHLDNVGEFGQTRYWNYVVICFHFCSVKKGKTFVDIR